MSYLEHVTTYFVSLVGKGLTLSSRDVTLVRQWEAAGIPPGVVCRALRMAVQQRPGRRMTTLADCEDIVRRLSLSLKPSTPAEQRTTRTSVWTRPELLRRLVAAGQSAELEVIKATYRVVYRQVQALVDEALTVDDVSRLDELAVSSLLERLPRLERREIERAAEAETRHFLRQSASGSAQERFKKAKIEQAVCENYPLTLPSSLLLDEVDQ